MSSILLWFDNERTTAAAVQRAAKRFLEKYGHLPTTAFVSDKSDDGSRLEGILIETARPGGLAAHNFYLTD